MSETTVSLSESEELSSGAEPSWMGSTGVWEIGIAVRGRDGGGARELVAGWVREAEAEARAARPEQAAAEVVVVVACQEQAEVEVAEVAAEQQEQKGPVEEAVGVEVGVERTRM